ncbi:MAG: hypothetical protein GW778_01395 [Alphaproteobacteria bacterium]|nr:hypothetical protein [Alphaproteobacteria bacterium]
MDLFFAPKRIYLSDKEPVTELRVTNTGNLARAYTVMVEDLIMTEEGVTARVDGFDYSAKRMVRFVPRQFTLEPGGRQIVRIMARISPDKPDGDYHSHMEFLENVSRRDELNPKDDSADGQIAKASAKISYSLAIPITVSKGEVSTRVDIGELALKFDEKGKPFIAAELLRSGNGQGNVLLDVDYIAPDGQVTKAGPRRTIYVYRELDRVKRKIAIQLIEGVQMQKGGAFKVTLFNRDISEVDPVKELTLAVN